MSDMKEKKNSKTDKANELSFNNDEAPALYPLEAHYASTRTRAPPYGPSIDLYNEIQERWCKVTPPTQGAEPIHPVDNKPVDLSGAKVKTTNATIQTSEEKVTIAKKHEGTDPKEEKCSLNVKIEDSEVVEDERLTPMLGGRGTVKRQVRRGKDGWPVTVYTISNSSGSRPEVITVRHSEKQTDKNKELDDGWVLVDANQANNAVHVEDGGWEKLQ